MSAAVAAAAPAGRRRRQRKAALVRLFAHPRLSIDATWPAHPRSPSLLLPNAPRRSFPSSSSLQGCWQLAGGHGREVFDGIEATLAAHADAGCTTFDTADIYGPSESILGAFAAARRAQAQAAGPPAPLQLLTKYVPNIFQQRVTPGAVEAAARKSMAALRVEALDCVQLHWWDYAIPGMVDAALCLADLKAKGLIRAVGVTNMDVEALARIVDAGVPVVSNQVRGLRVCLCVCE